MWFSVLDKLRKRKRDGPKSTSTLIIRKVEAVIQPHTENSWLLLTRFSFFVLSDSLYLFTAYYLLMNTSVTYRERREEGRPLSSAQQTHPARPEMVSPRGTSCLTSQYVSQHTVLHQARGWTSRGRRLSSQPVFLTRWAEKSAVPTKNRPRSNLTTERRHLLTGSLNFWASIFVLWE